MRKTQLSQGIYDKNPNKYLLCDILGAIYYGDSH